MSALERFAELEAEIEAARARLTQEQERRREAVQRLERAETALHEHIAGVVSGEREDDSERHDDLHRQAREAGEAVSVRVVNYGQTSEAQLVDVAAEARVAGAGRRLELAEAALRDFARARLAELAAELARGASAEVGREAFAAVSAARRASARWNEVYGRWAAVLRAADQVEALQSAPASPFGGLEPIDVDVLQLGPAPRGLF